MTFTDRADAGRQLAARLTELLDGDGDAGGAGGGGAGGVVVLGLPRGGVPVAYEVAQALGAVLDVLVVRKLGVPFMPELAMGAIGEGGVKVINPDVVNSLGITPETIEEVEGEERAALDRRLTAIRALVPQRPLAGVVAVVVDDGIATGATAAAACAIARAHGAARIVLAAPVVAAASARALAEVADAVVAVEEPRRMSSIGRFYDDFGPVPEHEVLEILARGR